MSRLAIRAPRSRIYATIHWDGTLDVTDSGIDVRPNQDVAGVEIVLFDSPPTVSGIVTDARHVPIKDYAVILFARDPARWAFASRYVAIGQPDKNGQFDVRSLAEGRYYAIALESVGAGDVTDPEFLRQLQTLATVVTVRDGETTSLALQLQRAVPSPF